MRCRCLDRFRAINTRISGRKSFQTAQCGVKQTNPAAIRPALDMVVGGGELDEALEKLPRVAARRQPVDFPGFVRVPESMRVEELYAREQG